MAALRALHAALPEGAEAIVTDIVWQTAPTPALALALAPPPGAEKVRPIEGYEMQLEHVGFRIVERADADTAAFLATVGAPSNERRAARVCTWRVQKSTEGPEA